MGFRFRRALPALLLSCLVSSPSHANGRFPRAQRLIEDPADASHLILGATYGTLITHDRGQSWRYLCEATYGAADVSVDGMQALSPNGVLLAGVYSSISRVATGVCNFERTLGMTNRETVPDFALAASEPGRVLAILVTIPEQGAIISQVHRSDDDGATWRAVGEPLPPELSIPLTIDVAPSDADRVYISGLGALNQGILLRSDDGGESFTALGVPSSAAEDEHPYIAAVDPIDPDSLYVRTDFWAPDPETGATLASDALFHSKDGGASFTELIRAHGKLLGFAFSPDGSELLLGYGDPIEPGNFRFVDPEALGIYRAAVGSWEFEQRYVGSVGCLSWTQQGIFACTHESETGFSLGLIEDSEFDLESPAELEPLLKLADVVGPVECDDGTPGAICLDFWRPACEEWGRTDCLELGNPLGSGGESGDPAGLGGSKMVTVRAGGPSSADTVAKTSGCGCRGHDVGSPSSAGLLLAGLTAAVARARWHRRRIKAGASR